MKVYFALPLLFLTSLVLGQQTEKYPEIERACLNYIEGFYEGDTTKLQAVLTPSLYKQGYWKSKEGKYESEGLMSYDEAIGYARNVLETKKFAGAEAPKKVQVLDVSDHIAAAKVTAWWGVDYILLSKAEDRWIIEQVLWEGPLQSPASDYVKRLGPGIICTDANEYSVAFIKKGWIAFTRADGEKKIMFSKRVDGEWTTPTVAPFSTEWDNEYSSFNQASQRLYFSSTRPSNGEETVKAKNDIWYVEWTGESWTDPVHLGGNFSTPGIDSGGAEDQGTIYFHSDRNGAGLNSVDIFSLDNPGETPQKINLSTDQIDGEPFLFADGQKMLFMSGGHGAVGKSDIFFSEKKNNEWQTPISIDTKGIVNTDQWEYSPSLSPRGKILFFTRIVDGQADIYWLKTKFLSEEIANLLVD